MLPGKLSGRSFQTLMYRSKCSGMIQRCVVCVSVYVGKGMVNMAESPSFFCVITHFPAATSAGSGGLHEL